MQRYIYLCNAFKTTEKNLFKTLFLLVMVIPKDFTILFLSNFVKTP